MESIKLNDKENHILVGLGGTGGRILREFKKRMVEEFPDKKERDSQSVALLYVDSTKEYMGIGRADMNVLGQDASFGANEFLYIKGCDVPELLDNIDNHPELRGVVDNVSAVRTAIGNLGAAAGQKRRAGRLLFAVNARQYVNALKNCFARCSERSHNHSKNIHIFAGLCGGTGSGAIVDAIVQARNIAGWEDAQINVYAMIPEQDLPDSSLDKGRYYENGYAALCELNALQCGRYTPCDVLASGSPLNLFNESTKGVANGLVVYSNVNSNGRIVDSLEELPKIVSDFIYSRVFLINSKAGECKGFIDAFNFENMDDSEFEYDETVSPKEADISQERPIVRTKKLYSFGIKRVIYPELRVLQHMTYTVGQSVLYQFKYNNWRPSLGFINEAVQISRDEYLNEDNLIGWMLDESHLTLDKEVLTAKDGTKFESFHDEWESRVDDFVDWCRESENPLNELSRQMESMFNESFRNEGVRNYFNTQARSADRIAKKIRNHIEEELFNQWRDGQISIVELSDIGENLATYVSSFLKDNLNKSVGDNKEWLKESREKLHVISENWGHVGFWGKYVIDKKEGYYTEYKNELIYNLVLRTRQYGLDFAKQLASELQREIGKMSDDINAFSKMLSDAIDETNRLITAQQKTNKGLEDMFCAVIEVSEEERMIRYEDDIRFDKEGMYNVARQIRQAILPDKEFNHFGDLLTRINVRTIKNEFDDKLSKIIQAKHADLPPSSTKVLGLNILTQLQQKLGNNYQKVQEFAHEILQQSGAYINLDRNQIISNIRNNDQPDENKNINLQEVLISIPSPDDNPGLTEFAKDLKRAFESQAETGVKPPKIFMKSTRKNELSIITINYSFPMRAISWLVGYKKRYTEYLHTGNANQDLSRAILLHSEGLGNHFPDIFAKSDAELRKIDEETSKNTVSNRASSLEQVSAASSIPPVSGSPMPPVVPFIQLYLAIGGQQYGPYDWNACKQLVVQGQLTQQTMVWEQGMSAWTPAGQIEKLQELFATALPAGMPPLPPTSGSVPPPINI